MSWPTIKIVESAHALSPEMNFQKDVSYGKTNKEMWLEIYLSLTLTLDPAAFILAYSAKYTFVNT